MLNVDLKMISTAYSEKLREALPYLISSQQTVYVQNRHFGEIGRLISDVIDITKTKTYNSLVTMDFKKAFDSLDNNLLILTLKKYDFGQSFTLRLKILQKDQEPYVINGGKTTKYFLLCRSARQGYPISAILFILTLEILFLLIKTNREIVGLAIFNHCYLYSAYPDDTTFFLKDNIFL